MKEETINILALGIYGVGRRSLINRFFENTYVEGQDLNKNLIKSIKLNNNQTINVFFHVHNRSEKFYQLSPSYLYFKNCKGIILAYDINSKYTFESLSEALEVIYDYVPKEFPIILVGNKLDEGDNFRQVKTEEGQAFATKNGFFAFYETSAKENINVNECLNKFIDKIIQTYSIFPKEEEEEKEKKLKKEKKNNSNFKKKCIK